MHGPRQRCDNPALQYATKAQIRADSGYTLLELVVVTSIIALFAAVALPGMRPVETERIDLAAAWLADTVRFARSEALRTGNPIYFEVNHTTEELLVAEADISGVTATAGQTLNDPITRQPLDIILSDFPSTANIDISNWPFDYPTSGVNTAVVFDPYGLPFTKKAGVVERMELGSITLIRGGQVRTVQIAAITGRVTIE